MTSQLFESRSLEEALAEVRDTVGPNARIVRAEKVRRGGIAGFFSKESYVLSVEQDEEPAVRIVPSEVPMSLDDLVDAVDAVDGDDGVDAGPRPAVSTETSKFGQVLRQVSRGADVDPELPPGPRWSGHIVDLDARAPEVVTLEPAGDGWRTHYQEEAPSRAWWQVLADVAESERRAKTGPPPVPPPAPLVTPGAELVPLPPLPPEAIPPTPLAPAPPVPGGDPAAVLGGEVIDVLIGVAPTTVDSAAIQSALLPTLLPGSVIAVVGHPSDAGRIAAAMTIAATGDPFSIHLASPDPAARATSGLPAGRQVASLDEAILRSRRWPSRPSAVVLVVDGRDPQWARTVLDAVEATTVIGVPSPLEGDTAVREWVADLGGVQALLVDDNCVSTPESLALQGIPALYSPWALGRPELEAGER